MDALARKFHTTHEMKVKQEIERLAKEYGKLGEPWGSWHGKCPFRVSAAFLLE
jgi:hypothetical protein